MTNEPLFDPPVGLSLPAESITTSADAQTMAEAALGRALMMVQRMEEDARHRADELTSQRLAQAEREAHELLEQARQRAAAIAEITRDSVARVLADEHTALLEGLSELADLEQRLRSTVAISHERIAAVLNPGTEQPAPSPEVVEPAPAPPTPSPPSPLADLDLDAPVVGADDAFFADLRQAVDGSSSIAGREPRPAEPTPRRPPVVPIPSPQRNVAPSSPAPSPGGTQASALTAAAAAATAAVARPMSLTDPVPTGPPPPGLRVVPPVPLTPMPPVPIAPAPAAPGSLGPEPALPLEDGDLAGPSGESRADSRSRRERSARKRSKWAMVGTGLRNLGILMLLFVAFQLWGTAALEHRDQAKLRHSFQMAVASQSAPSQSLSGGDPADPSTVTTPTTVAAPPAAPSGEAVAVIKIPKIGVEQAVVEGTGVNDLRKGPGHYRNTPLPGQPGNAAIAGHRTTYGAPFNRIDELAPGDPILVATLQGNFKYIVSEAPFPVRPSQNDVLFNKSDNRLTLTTCHPKYSAEKRLIVVAKLAPRVKPALAAKPTTKPQPRVVADASTGGDVGALLPALFWGALAALAYAGMVVLSRRWVRRAAFLLGVPVVLALLFPFFEQLSRLLPANY